MIARRLFVLGFAGALLAAFGCGNDGGSGTSAPAFVCSDSGAAAANTVILSCGGATSGTTEQVDVVIGGPASGTTSLRGLNFDVTYDPANVQFVPAGSYTSPLFPNALIVVTLANGQQGRLVVSIQLPGGQSDSTVAPGEHSVLTLAFSRVSGITFAPSSLTFENTDATSASAPIAFTSALALSYQ